MFKRNKKMAAPAAIVGQPVFVNPPITSTTAWQRNEARIGRLEQSIQNFVKAKEAHEVDVSWVNNKLKYLNRELQRRKLARSEAMDAE